MAILREIISLLGFFPASCDLIKNPPILVAIILRFMKLCLWHLLYPSFYCYYFEFIPFRNPNFSILLSVLFGFISVSIQSKGLSHNTIVHHVFVFFPHYCSCTVSYRFTLFTYFFVLFCTVHIFVLFRIVHVFVLLCIVHVFVLFRIVHVTFLVLNQMVFKL